MVSELPETVNTTCCQVPAAGAVAAIALEVPPEVSQSVPRHCPFVRPSRNWRFETDAAFPALANTARALLSTTLGFTQASTVRSPIKFRLGAFGSAMRPELPSKLLAVSASLESAPGA